MNRPRAKVEEDELESRNGESIALGPSLETVSNVRISRNEGLEPVNYLLPLLCGADLMSTGANYELARDARIWSTYVREAERWDEDMVGGWNRFLIESAKNLQPDPTETALREVASLLRVQVLNATSPTEAGFTPSLAAVWVNALWFLSLSLSVSVSLVAMLAKTMVLFRRLDGLERWKMPEILAFLPTLMHLSLDSPVLSIPVFCITALTFIFYATTTILPLGNAYCPYSTPLSHYIDVALRKSLSPFRKFGFTYISLVPQYDSGAVVDLTNNLSDQVTSRALGWLITDSQNERSPLIDSNVILRLATRFMACPSQDPKIKLTGITSLEAASLYARALTFVMSCASDQVSVASELKRVTEAAPDRRPILMDSGSSCLHDSDITRANSNVAAFGAACMGIWREFWTQVEWIWFKAPITTSYNLLKKYSEGELTLHSSAVVALVKRIALEAARWFDLRYAHDRGHVVMVLVKLVSRTSLHFL
ncbi:hypothetical protein RhiTH_006084 [Rhizoctonia solani]